MKILPNSITTFHKLKFSYITLVIIVALLVGSVSYTYFSSAFNKEIEQTNAVLLKHYQNVINNVLENADRLSLTLSVKQFNNNDIHYFFEHPVKGNNSKILSVYRYLTENVLANFETIDSISVYYDSADMLISSTTGVSFLNDQRADSRSDRNWIPQNEADSKNTIYSFIRPYPKTSDKSQIKGFIAVNIKEEALSNIVSQFTDYDYGILNIVDEAGNVILNSGSAAESHYLQNGVEYAAFEAVSYEPVNEIINVDGKKVMVSHVTLYNRWKLVHVSSIDEFYSKTTLIRRTIAVICFIAIVLGFVIAGLFTRNIYNPLRLLIKKIFDSKNESITNDKNEYNIINKYIDNLSVKMEKTEQIIENNKPLINHNLVTNLILGRITTEEEFNGFLELNRITMPHPSFRVMLVQFSERLFKNITMGNKQRIKYFVTDFIDSLSDPESVFVTSFSTEHEAAIIVNTCHDLTVMEQFAAKIISHLESSVKLETRICIGKPVELPTEVKLSYTDAKNLSKYGFFMRDKRIFTEENTLDVINIKSEMPVCLMDSFMKALRERNLDEIKTQISKYIELTQGGEFLYETCWTQLVGYVNALEEYVNNTGLNIGYLLEGIYDIVTSMYDANDFEEWIINTIERIFHAMDQMEEDKNNIVVQKAISFVLENLQTGLSLREVAEHVCWSPSHFSKTFKQVTGKNFVDFVMEERINRAKIILLEDDQITIEEVAQKVGYNSAAYFINKFKLVHGVTPKNFRLLCKDNKI